MSPAADIMMATLATGDPHTAGGIKGHYKAVDGPPVKGPVEKTAAASEPAVAAVDMAQLKGLALKLN